MVNDVSRLGEGARRGRDPDGERAGVSPLGETGAERSAPSGHPRALALLAAVALAGFLFALDWVARHGYRHPLVASVSPRAPTIVYAITAAVGLGCALAPAVWRRAILIAGSAVAYAWLLRWWAAPVFGFALVVCGLGRTALRVRTQVAITVLVWGTFPLLRALAMPHAWQRGAFLPAVIWAAMVYAAIYVLVERGRHPGERTLADELFYFFALPRLAEPFFQPISCRYLHAQELPRPSLRLIARGLALGALGIALAVTMTQLVAHTRGLPPTARLGRDFLLFYATVTHQIFIAVAMFRLLGFDLASGYRAPFLSGSFAEFFRRYNHYVRDAVMSLFYFPLLGHLRRRLPRRAAKIAAAFGAILVGSFLLNDLLVPVVTNPDPRAGFRMATVPLHLLVLAIYWALIIVPPEVVPARADGKPWLPRIARIVLFNVAFFLIWLHIGWYVQR